MATTPTYQLPTPEGTDQANIPVDTKRLADAVEVALKAVAGREVIASTPLTVTASSGGTVAVTFPAGRFLAGDRFSVSLTKLGGSLAKYIPYVAAISATGMTIGLYSGDGTATTGTITIQYRVKAY